MADLQMKNFEDICTKCEVSEETKNKLYDKYFKYAKDPVISTIVNFILEKKEDYKILEDTLQNCNKTMGEYSTTQLRPLMIFPNKDQINIRIYPNIILDKDTNYSKLQSFSISDAISVLSTFTAEYEADMASPARAEKWANPERISKRLGDYVDMPTARALTRYCNYEAAFKPDQIRDFAAKVDIARKPLELIFADTPEDMFTMYASGPSSCMSPTTEQRYTEGWKFLTDNNLAPPSFYAHFPYTRGAYIMKNGKVASRVVLWADTKSVDKIINLNNDPSYTDMGYPTFKKDLCERWYYGRIYSETQEMTNKFIASLKSHGITPLDGQFKCPEGVKFIVPGLKMNSKTYGMPFPYFDNLEGVGGSGYYGKGFFAEYNAENKQFTLTYQKAATKNSTIPINGRGGFLKSSDYQELKCDHCSISIKSKAAVNTDDGFSFCGDTCASSKGYVWAIQGNGNRLYTKPDESFIKSEDGLLFTTLRAAQDNGYYLKMGDLGVMPEENEVVTAAGFRTPNAEGDTYVMSPTANFEYSRNPIPIDIEAYHKVIEFNQDDLAA